MPDIDGFELLRQLQSNTRTASIPVMAVSASAIPSEVDRGLQAGFRHDYTKPLDIAEFVELVEQTLANSGNAGVPPTF